jgi:hypothetical protein
VLYVHEGIYRVSVIAESYFRHSAKLAKLFTHLTQVFIIMRAGEERDGERERVKRSSSGDKYKRNLHAKRLLCGPIIS